MHPDELAPEADKQPRALNEGEAFRPNTDPAIETDAEYIFDGVDLRKMPDAVLCEIINTEGRVYPSMRAADENDLAMGRQMLVVARKLMGLRPKTA